MRHQASRGPLTLQQHQALLHPDQEAGQLAVVGWNSLAGLDLQESLQAGKLETVELGPALSAFELVLGNFNNFNFNNQGNQKKMIKLKVSLKQI